jgi:2-methylaconitate cis-trans-isomerase PrpF
MGGGLSSLSKAVIYRRTAYEDNEADVEYTFVQVGVEDAQLDLTGNCGNLTSVVGPLALNEALFDPDDSRFDCTKTVKLSPLDANYDSADLASPVTIRLRNTNTSKLIHATFVSPPSVIEWEG